MVNVPEFSVIIPTHDRPRLLRRCLQSVLAQTLPAHRYEIIVVDDGSRRSTARALAPFAADEHLTILHQPQQGWGAARQTGARRSRGAILVFLDDDCVAPPGWLATYARAYAERPDVHGVAGGLRPDGPMNVAGRKQYLGHRAYFNHLNAPLGGDVDRAGRAWFTFGGNRSFRREIWWEVQPETPLWYFDDYAIDLALRERDYFIYYEPEAWVAHHYVLNVAQRIRAAYRYGRSEVGQSKEARRTQGGHGLPGVPGLPGVTTEGAATLGERWARLSAESPEASLEEKIWYAFTQPLAWIARELGKRSAMHRDKTA